MSNKKYFHTQSVLRYDANRLKKLHDKLQELDDERKALKEDLDSVAGAVRAASKLLTGDSPTVSEGEDYEHFGDNYNSFLSSDSESGNEETQVNYESKLGKIMKVKRYIIGELIANKSNFRKTDIKFGKTPLYPSDPNKTIEEKDSSSINASSTSGGAISEQNKNIVSSALEKFDNRPITDQGESSKTSFINLSGQSEPSKNITSESDSNASSFSSISKKFINKLFIEKGESSKTPVTKTETEKAGQKRKAIEQSDSEESNVSKKSRMSSNDLDDITPSDFSFLDHVD